MLNPMQISSKEYHFPHKGASCSTSQPTLLETVPSVPLASYPLIMKTRLISPCANSILSLSAGRAHCASLSKKKIFNSLSSLQIVSKWLNLGGKHQPLPEHRGRVLWAPWGGLSKTRQKLRNHFCHRFSMHHDARMYYISGDRDL